jgi:ribosomal protein L37AE/L43A
MNVEGVGIDFDKEEEVIGEYYGECPECKKKRNLTFEKDGKWVCHKCYYGGSKYKK